MASSKAVQPLKYFTLSGVDFASGRIPLDWEPAPGMSVVMEMRLEVDACRQLDVFGHGEVSKRSYEVRQKVQNTSTNFIYMRLVDLEDVEEIVQPSERSV